MNVLNSFQKENKEIQEGWRKVIFQDDKDDETILPIVAEGEEGKVVKVKVKEGKHNHRSVIQKDNLLR